MPKKTKLTAFNVRVYRRPDGTFKFDKGCFMHRAAKRGKDTIEWVDASERDRDAFKNLLAAS